MINKDYNEIMLNYPNLLFALFAERDESPMTDVLKNHEKQIVLIFPYNKVYFCSTEMQRTSCVLSESLSTPMAGGMAPWAPYKLRGLGGDVSFIRRRGRGLSFSQSLYYLQREASYVLFLLVLNIFHVVLIVLCFSTQNLSSVNSFFIMKK